MRILVTNDDGVHADGLFALQQALQAVGDVTIVAPERQQSATGHAITLHKPLRILPMKLSDGSAGFATSGTPTDCVTLGYEIVMGGKCDLVVSGINAGANLGWDLTYSGTVAAALEGAVLGLPAIAISLVFERMEGMEPDYGAAAEFVAKLARQVQADPLPPNMLLNVNVPLIPSGQLQEVVITHQGRREYVDRILVRDDPAGRPYYWQGGSIREDVPDPGSDVHAVLHNQISVTPVQLDMTAYPLIERLRGWQL